MNHCKILARNALQFTPSKPVAGRISMSSLAPQSQFVQSYLPPTLLPTVPSVSSNDLRTALILSLNTQPQRTSSLVNLPVYPSRTPIWHVTPLEIPISPHPLAIRHLENAPEPKPEEREPEKPKWEEEQFPDIGKSTLSPLMNYQNANIVCNSYRYCQKSSSISTNSTSTASNLSANSRSSSIPLNTS